MNLTVWIILLVILIIAITASIFYIRSRRKRMYQTFEKISQSAKQVPKQKKYCFILFTFKENVISAKNKKTNSQIKMNNPKFVESQLIQMGSILKDPSTVTDKNMKQALKIYDTYIQWEKKKF